MLEPEAQPRKEHPVVKVVFNCFMASLTLIALVGTCAINSERDQPRRPRPSVSHRSELVTQEERDAVSPEVTYFVNGSASAARLTYTNATGGTDQKEVGLPWRLRFNSKPREHAYISAQNSGESGTVYVEIQVNGKTLQTGEASTAYGIATASGLVP